MSQGVVDNEKLSRFELAEEGHVAFADYLVRDGKVVIPHVEAPVPLRGTGAAGRLMTGMLELIRERGQKVVPVCPYAVAFIRRHPEYQDLVA